MTNAGSPTTLTASSKNTGADGQLLGRITRYLAAIGAIDKLSNGVYLANHVTKNLAEKLTGAGVNHYFSTNPTDELHTAFQDAWDTTLDGFSWFSEHQVNLTYFNDFMALRREPQLSWLTVYPVREKTMNWSPDRPVYVNVGGGIGHQCAQLLEKRPDIPGRVILQDLPHSIANALPTPRVENMSYNFFQPQPVIGARFYYMRAMVSDSLLLIDEIIIPETGAHINAVSMDITMLAAFAGILKIVKTYTYNPIIHESVMEVRLL
ncbi:S-adenosyl-L-methionine-dependent methyltransferase [Xylariaceae sp. AK1471]|nr:S-adenosyl-L-methionine-dependent methyltransferase [Xylariaceae sp. AK1471]